MNLVRAKMDLEPRPRPKSWITCAFIHLPLSSSPSPHRTSRTVAHLVALLLGASDHDILCFCRSRCPARLERLGSVAGRVGVIVESQSHSTSVGPPWVDCWLDGCSTALFDISRVVCRAS